MPFVLYAQVVLLVIALGQILGRSFQTAPPAPLYNPAPVPFVSYQRPAETVPVWLEKDWWMDPTLIKETIINLSDKGINSGIVAIISFLYSNNKTYLFYLFIYLFI